MAQAFITRRKGGGGVNKDLPAQVTAFTATADSTPSITLNWINPAEYWAGTLIVKKAGSAPEGVNDGEKIHKGEGTSYTDFDVSFDTEYFYRAFPYNEKKQYQTAVNVVSAEPLETPDNFADATWAQIDKASTSGKIPSTWVVGSEKDIVLSTGEVLTLVIVGINHDDLADGSGKVGLTIGLKNLMAETKQMNPTKTASGGFPNSQMYDDLHDTIFLTLPSDLQNVIKTVSKKASNNSKGGSIITYTAKLFLFTEIEIFGSVTYSLAGEGSHYPYFNSAAARTKKYADGTTEDNGWYEASPFYLTNDGYFCYVSSTGTKSNSYSWGIKPRGVCFGFCV